MMKNIKMVVICITLGFSSTAFAQFSDLMNQAVDSVDSVKKSASTVTNVKETVKTGVADSVPTGLIDSMVNQLGVTKEQATGGSGALFQVAKSKMSDADFGQVSNSIPGMDGILAAAPTPKSTAATSTLSGLSSLAGDNSGIANAASLMNSFKQLDLSEGMVGKFSSFIVDYVKKGSGDVVGNLLKSAITGS